MQIREMIGTHPEVRGNVTDAMIRVIEEGSACARICTSCADACLAEQMVADLRQCIRLDLDCADMCNTVAGMAARRTGSNEKVLRAAIEACATACRTCAEECRQHAGMHEHCRICAEACDRCAEACEAAAREIR